MKGTHLGAVLVTVIIVTAVIGGVIFLNNSGYKAPILTPNNIAAPASNVPQSTSSAPPVGTPTSWKTGTSQPVTISVVDRDYLANTALTELTNVQNTFYTSVDGTAFTFLQAAVTAATGVTAVVPANAGGIIYVQSQIVAGQSYYIAPLITQNSNACVTGYDFMDISNGGTKQWIFRCDLSKSGLTPSANNAGGAGGNAPLLTWTLFNYAYTAPTGNTNTAYANNIGTTVDKSTQILYYAGGTAAKAFALAELDVQINSTDNTKWNQGSSNILFPTMGPTGAISYTQNYLTSANQIYTDGTNYYYKWYFNAPIDTTFLVNGAQQTNNLKGAYFYWVSNNGGQTQIPFTLNWVSDYGATTGELITMKWVYLSAAQGQASVTSAVKACAAASPVCTT